jgi:hypothetical protein
MTDKLTEALAWYGRPEGYTSHVETVLVAANRWASFPTDDDVEAAAKAGMELAPGFDIYAGGQWRVVMRAALEAVKREDR